jgi:hypothetical protein
MHYLIDKNEDYHAYRQRLVKLYGSAEIREEILWSLAKEWIDRYNRKAKQIGKVKATTWWHTQADIMEAKRGLPFVQDLKRRMNDIRRNNQNVA